MPPKLSQRLNRNLAIPEVFPIFSILSDSSESIEGLFAKMEQAFSSQQDSLFRSLLVATTQMCGLSALACNIDFKNAQESLEAISETACQKSPSSIQINSLDSKHPEHKEFMPRLVVFFDSLISEDFSFMKDPSILDCLQRWLSILTGSKLRVVRQASMELSRVFLSRIAYYHEHLIQSKSSKKAAVIMHTIKAALNSILKNRLKDVEFRIRHIAYLTLEKIILKLETNILSDKFLHEYILPLLKDPSFDVVESCLRLVSRLSTSTPKIIRALYQIGDLLTKPLEQLSLQPNQNGYLSLTILLNFSRNESSQRYYFNPELVAKVFEVFGRERYSVGVQLSIEIFYESLFPSVKQLAINRSTVIVELIFLLSSQVLSQPYLIEQFCKHPYTPLCQIFNLDDLFVLLLNQFYRKQSTDVHFKPKELDSLISLILKYQSCFPNPNYNRNVLSNCKEILLEIIPRSTIPHRYLELLSHVTLPVQGPMEVYLDLIIEKTTNMFIQSTSIPVLKQIVHIYSVFRSHDINLLAKHVKPSESPFHTIALLRYYQIESFMSIETLECILKQFSRERCLELLIGCYTIHQWSFKIFLSQLSLSTHKQYLQIRDTCLKFLFDLLSENTFMHNAFAILVLILRTASHNQLPDSLQYQLTDDQYDCLYRYFNNDSMDITRLMSNLTIEPNRSDILQSYYELVRDCHRIALHKDSLLLLIRPYIEEPNTTANSTITANSIHGGHIKLASNMFEQLIEEEAAQRNRSKFVFWRFVTEINKVLNERQPSPVYPTILNRLLSLYLKKANRKELTRILLNKLMLYLAGEVEHPQSHHVLTVLAILKKTHRKYSKDVLSRLLNFIQEKATEVYASVIDFLQRVLKDEIKKEQLKEEYSRKESEEESMEEKEVRKTRSHTKRSL